MLRVPMGVAVGTAVLALGGAVDGVAGQWITQTACHPVLIEGTLHREVAFEVWNISRNAYDPIEIILAVPVTSSAPEETCWPVRSVAPETWATFIEKSNGHIVWGRAYENSSTLLPGESLEGFLLALTREHSCCFDFYFSGVLEPFAHQRVCFECDAAVSTTSRTWGAVKAMYR